MPIEVTDATFKTEVLEENEKVVIVDFWAPWCGPCQMMAPVLEDLAGEVKDFAKVAKLNVDENQATAGQYGIMSIPTLMIFKEGKPVKQLVGVQSKEALVEELKSA